MNDKTRVVLIGPVLPFRGGIAQHTTVLHRSMTGLTDHITISFKRQYPAWLFPGESDRDPYYVNHREPGVDYLIDSLNPLSWLAAVRVAMAFNPQLIVIPWWTIFWAPCFGYLAMAFRRKGVPVLFFCHNVIEHESRNWKSWLTRKVLANGSRFAVHTQQDKANLERFLPNPDVTVHVHPIYDQFPAAKGTLPRRRHLELLFYGFVRPYKGLDLLIEAMGKLKGEDIQLTVAGEFWEGEEETQLQVRRLGIDNQVELRPRYQTQQETAELFERADIVILPYRSATGTGVVPLAYHYNTPVIVTRVGGLPDVVEHGLTGWIVDPQDPTALAVLLRSISRETVNAMKPMIENTKKSMSWESMVKSILKETEYDL